MFVNQEEIKLGIAKYVDNEIASKATGFNKFMVYFAMPIINKKVESFVKSFSDNEMTSDFFNENKQVDIDKVYNMAKDAIKKVVSFSITELCLTNQTLTSFMQALEVLGEIYEDS